MNFSIAVIGTRHRPPLIVPHLKRWGIPFDLRIDPEPNLEPGWEPLPQFVRLTPNQRNMMRCHNQHRDAIVAHVKKPGDVVLVLEDDCVPLRPDFMDVAESASKLVSPGGREDLFGAVFLCSFLPQESEEGGWAFRDWEHGCKVLTKRPKSGPCHHWATAVLHGWHSQHYLGQLRYTGLPIDLLIAQWLAPCAWIKPNVFDHDRSVGSLMEPPGHGILAHGTA